jgi:hypothetical protein
MNRAFLSWATDRRAVMLTTALLIVLAIARVSATYAVFSHTYDEPLHIAAGMELLDRGTYTYEEQHPPLARLAVALGPYLLGARSHWESSLWDEGNAILYSGADYLELLSVARAGVLPFMALLILATAAWAARDFGWRASLAAALLVSTLPPILAHAGLATTDLPLTATLTVALALLVDWMNQPRVRTGACVGVAAGLAVMTKLSALAFLPACAVALLLTRIAWAGHAANSCVSF